ncbi:MAG: S-adenosylmethionine:tRNA ribosyltransferase-isomerase [Chloroherpetonaceae bacterium]|nr:S-adenosylmethionine:tRNA ribosyltransferase-isomerase [Chloroherpetonaceae bacterium]
MSIEMPSFPHQLLMSDYSYELPPQRIALMPLENRDHSKLLLADAFLQKLNHHSFFELPQLLPPSSLLIRNNTRVISARLMMNKLSGGRVEILCTEPVLPSTDLTQSLFAKGTVRWKALVGGKKIFTGAKLSVASTIKLADSEKPLFLKAEIIEKSGSDAVIDFVWSPESLPFAAILETLGKIPLPPYIKRETTDSDTIRYQTVYAVNEGSVAAPTAGLHFTDRVFEGLRAKHIEIQDLTLHVGLGTFKPVESNDVLQHVMHREKISIPKSTIESLLQFLERPLSEERRLVAVGTTSARTLESLYWFGTKLIFRTGLKDTEISLGQWEVYKLMQEKPVRASAAFDAVLEWMLKHQLESAVGETQLFILPPYEFKVCNALITNFHQPESTLMLMVAAFLRNNFWREVYHEALAKDYRFLSYGDSSLLLT